MNSRERVIATLNYDHPDRLPRDIWALPYVREKRSDEYNILISQYPGDFLGVSPDYPPGIYFPSSFQEIGTYQDEWGSVWQVAEAGIIGEVKKPALDNWSKLSQYNPPWDLIKKRRWDNVNRICEQSNLFTICGATVRIFERMQFLRGTENLFTDIAFGTAEFRQLLTILQEFYLEDLYGWCKSNVDAIYMMDDWGTNQRLLINPKTWREIFKPIYQQFCNVIHSAGKYVFFHSDGNIQSIYGDLIEVGVNAINSQLFTMDIEALGLDYKGKVTFWGEIDRQHILPFGTPQEVRQAVHRVRKALHSEKGGVIAQCEWGKFDPIENIQMVYKTWLEE